MNTRIRGLLWLGSSYRAGENLLIGKVVTKDSTIVRQQFVYCFCGSMETSVATLQEVGSIPMSYHGRIVNHICLFSCIEDGEWILEQSIIGVLHPN